ncbi:MAG: glutamate--cysteine ligase, partial [Candidatus Margulisiibacteriota bacterium]
DNGTYGMGVLSINDPYEILNLNRKRRNKLLRGKSSQPIENLIIQEGIPSAKIINNIASEEVIYLVNGDTVGGFYRMHETKTAKDILNSKGMQFKAFNTSIDQHFSKPNENIDNYGISKTSYVIAQLANISAQKELSLI